MKRIDMSDVDAFIKLEDGTKEVCKNCHASIERIDEIQPDLYLKLERDDSVSYFNLDRVVAFMLRKQS